MPVLKNQRHELFAQCLAKGLSASEAFNRAGYKANRGNATRLKANESVSARVAELKESIADLVVVDRAWVLTKLTENVERAMQERPVLDSEGNPTGEYRYDGNVANGALKLLGQDLGMFAQKVDLTGRVDTGSVFELARQEVEEASKRKG